jgi:putative addiction module antidote
MPIVLRRRVRRVGNSLGVGLPNEITEILKVKEGDNLEFATTNGDVIIRKGILEKAKKGK